MASRAFTSRLLAPLRSVTARPTTTAFHLGRAYSTPASTPDPADIPPLLQKLKGDLKTAMRAKDAPRLAVLRDILSKVLNASKTDQPVRTDHHLVGLLRKAHNINMEAVKEFGAAKRDDLVEKEEAQAAVVMEYIEASGVRFCGEEELRPLVKEAFEAAKAAGLSEKAILGEVMKRVVGPRQAKMGGDWKSVPRMVKELQA